MESEGQKTFVPLHDFVVEVIQYCKPLHWEEAVACVNLVEKDSVGLASHYVSGGLPYLLTSFPNKKLLKFWKRSYKGCQDRITFLEHMKQKLF